MMNSKNTKFALLGLFVLVAAGAIFYMLNRDSGERSANAEPQKVTILKYSDYSCPSCRSMIPTQERLKEEFGDLIEIEYRHFPLGGFQYSRLAAHVVEAARNQGKYKEMHDLIFENQHVWTRGNARDHFNTYAEQIGLDMEQFAADIESDEIEQLVESQRREGDRRLVSGTPTYFINGNRIQQIPATYEQFKSIVELYMYRS